MNKLNKKYIKILFILIIFIIIIGIEKISNAAYASISSNSSVEKNESINISVNGSGVQWKLELIIDGTVVATSAELDNYESNKNINFSYKYTPQSTGTKNIKLQGSVTEYSDGSTITSFGSKTITVTEPVTQPSTPSGSSSSGGTTSTTKPTTNSNNTTETKKSTDSLLSVLSIAEGAIVPEFNKDIKEYSLSVPNEVTILNITATPNDTKASVNIEGNTDLKEGENIVTITVTAEDGNTSKYIVKVTRNRPTLSLKTLTIKYKNQNGELIEAKLNPEFSFDIYEYTLEDLEYWIEKLEIEAISNIEGATIEIEGADNLVTGENIIKITVKTMITTENPETEGTEEQEEIKTYKIKVNKKEAPVPPTLMGRISNWFNGIMGSITTFYSNNQKQVILSALGFCVIALTGLSIYIIIDYKKYKILIEKLKKITEVNKLDVVQSIEEIPSENSTDEITEEEKSESDKRRGRHF